MYKILRPALFLFQPETIHHIIMFGLKIAELLPGGIWLLSRCFTYRNPSLKTQVLGLDFPNPVGLAAGFDKNGEVIRALSAFGFGFIEVGTVTPLAQPGNPKPRSFRLPVDKALINRMGFNNKGVKTLVNRLGSRSQGIIGGNIGKNTATPNEEAAQDYLKCFIALYDEIDYFVVNVSCPNVQSLRSLQSQDSLSEIVEGLTAYRATQAAYKPILLKLSPDLTNEQIDDALEVATHQGLDGVVAVNTTTSRANLKTATAQVGQIGNGGLSGQPLTLRAQEMVRYIRSKTDKNFVIIGVGGIMQVQDALDMLEAGANLIQVYSGFIYNGPRFARKICKAIAKQKMRALQAY